MPKQQKQTTNSDLMRYAGMGAQIFVSLGLAVFAGIKIDHWLNMRLPLLVWLLPFLVLCMMIYKLIRETSKKSKTDERKN